MRTTNFLIAVLMIFTIVIFTACANIRSIEDAISQFRNAVNAEDIDSLTDTLSEDSVDFDPIIIQGFLDYFDGVRPLSYGELTIIHTSDIDATVNTQATYFNNPTPVTVQFIMRKHEEVWKVRQYWDDWSGSFSNIWQKIGQTIILEGQ